MDGPFSVHATTSARTALWKVHAGSDAATTCECTFTFGLLSMDAAVLSLALAMDMFYAPRHSGRAWLCNLTCPERGDLPFNMLLAHTAFLRTPAMSAWHMARSLAAYRLTLQEFYERGTAARCVERALDADLKNCIMYVRQANTKDMYLVQLLDIVPGPLPASAAAPVTCEVYVFLKLQRQVMQVGGGRAFLDAADADAKCLEAFADSSVPLDRMVGEQVAQLLGGSPPGELPRMPCPPPVQRVFLAGERGQPGLDITADVRAARADGDLSLDPYALLKAVQLAVRRDPLYSGPLPPVVDFARVETVAIAKRNDADALVMFTAYPLLHRHVDGSVQVQAACSPRQRTDHMQQPPMPVDPAFVTARPPMCGKRYSALARVAGDIYIPVLPDPHAVLIDEREQQALLYYAGVGVRVFSAGKCCLDPEAIVRVGLAEQHHDGDGDPRKRFQVVFEASASGGRLRPFEDVAAAIARAPSAASVWAQTEHIVSELEDLAAIAGSSATT